MVNRKTIPHLSKPRRSIQMTPIQHHNIMGSILAAKGNDLAQSKFGQQKKPTERHVWW